MSRYLEGSLPKDAKAVVVIMAGGSGTRFWPMSRKSCPKQFLPLAAAGRSLIQATADRLSQYPVMVVTADYQKSLVREQLPNAVILSEPTPRNTAPCLGYAASQVLRMVGDVPMICLPADHIISGTEGISRVYEEAVEVARTRDSLVTIGIEPRSPETGYGYIESAATKGATGVMEVKRFVEKPTKERAEEYLSAGSFYWNSGMFAWRPSVILSAIAQHLPQISTELQVVDRVFATGGDDAEIQESFIRMKPESIDFGVLEKANNVLMLAGRNFTWSDIGSWASWAEQIELAGPVVQSEETIMVNCKQVQVVAGKRLIAAVGLENIIIVDTEDALLVCNRDSAQDVKQVVEALQKRGRDDLL